ncbi:MAG TPA: type II secretion system protein [Candidatus Dormibacteraeota bacterium]|jgi:general secretion pathway protein G|nr:type II secretion system protein [Candidatus Dormibacteraeota bacterium]
MGTQLITKHIRRRESGMTLLELIIACGILLVLAGAALPIARRSILYQKENELRNDLRDMKDAIDRYKEAADHRLIHTEIGNENYPPDLETLVTGVSLGTGGAGSDKKVRFLREIPTDPMTGQKDWQKRCVSDDPDSTTWCGKNVFDVYSNSHATGSDGRSYSEW